MSEMLTSSPVARFEKVFGLEYKGLKKVQAIRKLAVHGTKS